MHENCADEESFERYIGLIGEYFNDKRITPSAFLHSFGCQQNVSDGEKILGIVSAMGYSVTDDISSADLIIYNTCAVRESAQDRVFGMIGELKELKARKPELIIAICGCMVQQEQVVERIKRSYRQVDIVFGTFAMKSLPELIWKHIGSGRLAVDISQDTAALNEGIVPVRSDSAKAYVPVMYGCNNFCTYCIVPYVRGRERSRSSTDILNEVKCIANSGAKEIMLLGQNVNSYSDPTDNIDFPELLRRINDVDGDFRIRFMSSHPKDASVRLLDAIFDCEKVCRHLHLPVQSGSNRILEAMNRRYTVEKYMEIVDYLRSRDSGFSLTTDIIVGFPNEKREDFEDTLSLMRRVKYDNIYSFIYSKRSGTKAALIEDTTSDEDKSRWMRELLAVQREITLEGNQRFVGRTVRVLCDGHGRKDGFMTGKCDEFMIVEFAGDGSLIGKFVNVRIDSARSWALAGTIV